MPEHDEASAAVTPEEDSGTTTAVAPAKKPAPTRREPKKLPPYKVLLHNDEVNTFEHVIQSILKLTTLGLEQAVMKSLEAHEAGLSLLLVTHRERAELYQEQFASLSLTVTIEAEN